MTIIVRKLIQHKNETYFKRSIDAARKQGYEPKGIPQLSSCGTWQQLMTKEHNDNPGFDGNIKKWNQNLKMGVIE